MSVLPVPAPAAIRSGPRELGEDLRAARRSGFTAARPLRGGAGRSRLNSHHWQSASGEKSNRSATICAMFVADALARAVDEVAASTVCAAARELPVRRRCRRVEVDELRDLAELGELRDLAAGERVEGELEVLLGLRLRSSHFFEVL